MAKKDGVSKKTLTVIEYVWFAVVLIVAISIKDTYHLSLWKYICIVVVLGVIGETLIRKFIKVK